MAQVPAEPPPGNNESTLYNLTPIDFGANKPAVLTFLNTELAAGGLFPGSVVADVGMLLYSNTPTAAATEELLVLFLDPAPGQQAGPTTPRTLYIFPPQNPAHRNAAMNYGWDWLKRGATGALAGAGSGFIGGSLISQPLLGALGGAALGFGYGVFFADDPHDAGVKGFLLGGVGGPALVPVIRIASPAIGARLWQAKDASSATSAWWSSWASSIKSVSDAWKKYHEAKNYIARFPNGARRAEYDRLLSQATEYLRSLGHL